MIQLSSYNKCVVVCLRFLLRRPRNICSAAQALGGMGCGSSKKGPILPEDRRSILHDIFMECDDDRSGFLSVQEYQQLAQKQDAATLALQQAVFALIDTDHDGKLSLEECVCH